MKAILEITHYRGSVFCDWIPFEVIDEDFAQIDEEIVPTTDDEHADFMEYADFQMRFTSFDDIYVVAEVPDKFTNDCEYDDRTKQITFDGEPVEYHEIQDAAEYAKLYWEWRESETA